MKIREKVYREVLILIGQIADTQSCPFYSQLQTIRDNFFKLPPAKLNAYFKHLADLQQEQPIEPASVLKKQIERINKLLLRASFVGRSTARATGVLSTDTEANKNQLC